MSDTVIVLLMLAAPFVTIGLAYLLGSIIRFGAGEHDATSVPVWLFSRRKRLTHRKSQDVVGAE